MTNALQQMKYSSIKTFCSHFITGTREEMEVMGEVKEERDEAEEEEKRVGEGVMEVMEEEEGRKRKKVWQTLPFPTTIFLSPLPLLPPLHPSPSFTLCSFLSGLYLIYGDSFSAHRNRYKNKQKTKL